MKKEIKFGKTKQVLIPYVKDGHLSLDLNKNDEFIVFIAEAIIYPEKSSPKLKRYESQLMRESTATEERFENWKKDIEEAVSLIEEVTTIEA